MLDRILLKGFQAHDRLDVQFDPNITTIMGPSDTGKSSLLRAIRWLCLNRPRGNGFIRVGSKGMSVKVRVDGKTIERERDSSSNLYSLGKQKYKAFGNDVPDAIQSLLQLAEPNFQGQHDSLFWLGLSPPELARQLNKLVDLDSIDRITSYLGQHVRDSQSVLGIVQSRLEEAEKRRDGLAYVREAMGDLEDVEGLQRDSTELLASTSILSSFLTQLGNLHTKIGRAADTVRVGGGAVDIGAEYAKCDGVMIDLRHLLNLIEETKKKAQQKVPDISVLSVLYDRLASAIKDRADVSSVMGQVLSAMDSVTKSVRGLERAEKAYNDEVDGESCPICGSMLKEIGNG